MDGSSGLPRPAVGLTKRLGISLLSATYVFLSGFEFAPVPEPRNPDPNVVLEETTLTTVDNPQSADAAPALAAESSLPGTDSTDVASSSAAAALLPSAIAAGRTSGAFAVTNSGAATYSIPIWTPPGVGDVGLSLSLNYSSRG
jgi:hypothetical protein